MNLFSKKEVTFVRNEPTQPFSRATGTVVCFSVNHTVICRSVMACNALTCKLLSQVGYEYDTATKASAFRFVSRTVSSPYRTRLSTIGDRAFHVATVRIWNSLPQHITSATSLPIFYFRLKTYFFELCY